MRNGGVAGNIESLLLVLSGYDRVVKLDITTYLLWIDYPVLYDFQI